LTKIWLKEMKYMKVIFAVLILALCQQTLQAGKKFDYNET